MLCFLPEQMDENNRPLTQHKTNQNDLAVYAEHHWRLKNPNQALMAHYIIIETESESIDFQRIMLQNQLLRGNLFCGSYFLCLVIAWGTHTECEEMQFYADLGRPLVAVCCEGLSCLPHDFPLWPIPWNTPFKLCLETFACLPGNVFPLPSERGESSAKWNKPSVL